LSSFFLCAASCSSLPRAASANNTSVQRSSAFKKKKPLFKVLNQGFGIKIKKICFECGRGHK
jgi:hypothetical protein